MPSNADLLRMAEALIEDSSRGVWLLTERDTNADCTLAVRQVATALVAALPVIEAAKARDAHPYATQTRLNLTAALAAWEGLNGR